MSYLERLQEDWDTLGLYSTTIPDLFGKEIVTVPPAAVRTYDELHGMLTSLAENVTRDHYSETRNKLHEPDAEQYGLHTELARHAVSLAKLAYIDRRPTPICGDAEALLPVSMETDRISNPEKVSPIIVTRRKKAIGIIKQLGDTNYYALEDDPATHTHAGHFYRSDLDNAYYQPFIRKPWRVKDIDRPRKIAADHAFTIPVQDLGDTLERGARFSMFMIPVEARESLVVDKAGSDGDQARKHNALRTSHEFLQAMAQTALATAERVRIGPQYFPVGLASKKKLWKIIGR